LRAVGVSEAKGPLRVSALRERTNREDYWAKAALSCDPLTEWTQFEMLDVGVRQGWDNSAPQGLALTTGGPALAKDVETTGALDPSLAK